jgi:hypothetical protein
MRIEAIEKGMISVAGERWTTDEHRYLFIGQIVTDQRTSNRKWAAAGS